MPPKREAGVSPTQPPLKMIRIGTDTQEFDPMENKYRLAEEPSFSPFPNNEHETVEFDEENISSPGLRTDTITLLMKIEQLQTQLKYERRCRILAERELRELKEMNTLMMQMRHTAHELRVTLDHVMQGGEAAVAPQNSQDETVSFLNEPEAEMSAVHNIPEDDHNFLYLAENLQVPKNLYERIAEIGDYKKYTSALLMILFDRETLATHSLQGRRNTFTGEDSHKPQLPPEILRSIIDHVAVKFGVDSSQIKTAIRTKLNNEDKLLKKRLGVGKAENKPMTDHSFCQDTSLLPENGEMTNDAQL
ncbi:Protein insensitive [Larimichthys crocea]|uniref:Protein insensitive n=3 Tax=Larimichthys crocea TaxID=215358 RepID=A0A0F8AWV6_LARCR|nr:uncharacterized protein LOC109139248 isoform X3 [Larimichthys crocea]XP_027135672.1 uncharacterized protein LOC109139248 isoform X3 [Larimichthys crocea]XP_027135673.1 uncharacterized protein LOC109139248 isoform X3 [Larimichthys crocea]KAE8298468.1 Protein insensitive [Larimichthys crocea]KAE8298472.1 Protein insensitive [Larimichthys crocea]TMS19812.1 Protein insensitive [Larimichthys crocea]